MPQIFERQSISEYENALFLIWADDAGREGKLFYLLLPILIENRAYEKSAAAEAAALFCVLVILLTERRSRMQTEQDR